jgi:hypothetical protein
MSDITEGLGGMVQGALTGRAVEPERGEADTAEVSYDPCPNCGADPMGPYCHQCGQKQHVHRTLTALFHDLIHGVLHLDGKLSHTLPLLLFKPGKLTRRYIEGERAKFVSPMAMFLFSVFLMFAVFQMVGLTTPTTISGSQVVEDTVESAFEQASEAAYAERDRLREEIANLPEDATAEQRQSLETSLAELENGIEQGEARSGSLIEQLVEDNSEMELNLTGIESIDQGLIKKWRENPGLMLYKLQANGYKFSWLLIPISIPFVWLLFLWKRRFKAYDHAIFVTYSLSFMSLLFVTISLVATSSPGAGWAFAIFAIAAPLHVYKHLRHAYGLSRFSTIWRFLMLLWFIIFVLVLFLQALLLLGAF